MDICLLLKYKDMISLFAKKHSADILSYISQTFFIAYSCVTIREICLQTAYDFLLITGNS